LGRRKRVPHPECRLAGKRAGPADRKTGNRRACPPEAGPEENGAGGGALRKNPDHTSGTPPSCCPSPRERGLRGIANHWAASPDRARLEPALRLAHLRRATGTAADALEEG